jgi:hypothetical protein
VTQYREFRSGLLGPPGGVECHLGVTCRGGAGPSEEAPTKRVRGAPFPPEGWEGGRGVAGGDPIDACW